MKKYDGLLHNLDTAVPRAGAEGVFGDEVPMHGEDFAFVLVPRLYGELVNADIEELDGAIARRRYQLVLVDLRPGKIVESILRIEPAFDHDHQLVPSAAV